MKVTLRDLKHHAIASSLFSATTLGKAVRRLGFIQADPIRAPARAQDLILRHRVTDYHVGDLDRAYRRLHLEEDLLYAYGFMPRSTWQLLHPRAQRELTAAETCVLDIVRSNKRLHPRELDVHLGKQREINPWGGYSKSTTRSLERLHYLGLIRVAGRENGIKLYEPATGEWDGKSPEERLQQLALLIAKILAPVPERKLRAAVQYLRHADPDLPDGASVVGMLVQSGKLESAEADGVRYLWPAGRLIRTEPAQVVRFLAPFDPLVWDRRRFEHFWGWRYWFEAYTPPPKRKLGYYAMPLLWGADVVGWVNVLRSGNAYSIELGFVSGSQPSDQCFYKEYELESDRLRKFLSER